MSLIQYVHATSLHEQNFCISKKVTISPFTFSWRIKFLESLANFLHNLPLTVPWNILFRFLINFFGRNKLKIKKISINSRINTSVKLLSNFCLFYSDGEFCFTIVHHGTANSLAEIVELAERYPTISNEFELYSIQKN